MASTPGIYFDGISSKPQAVDVQLDELNAGLRFGTFSEGFNL